MNNEFVFDCIDMTDNGLEVVDTKVVYNLDGKTTVSDWAKEPIKGMKTFDAPQMTNGCAIKKEGKSMLGRLCENAIGYFYNNANSVYQSVQGVALFSSCFSAGHGFSITADNYTRCITAFSARKLIGSDWMTAEDEYMAPNTEHEAWSEFENDSIVCSLFSAFSQQSSLRGVEYKDKQWDIKNEFFWMSRAEIIELADQHNNTECYNDASTDKDRFVYTKLKDTQLSMEAQAVLDKASELVRLTFEYREDFTFDNPEYQCNNWDCGWYQIKAMAKKYCPNEFAEFNTLYKELGDKLRPMVYTLGFLK